MLLAARHVGDLQGRNCLTRLAVSQAVSGNCWVSALRLLVFSPTRASGDGKPQDMFVQNYNII